MTMQEMFTVIIYSAPQEQAVKTIILVSHTQEDHYAQMIL